MNAGAVGRKQLAGVTTGDSELLLTAFCRLPPDYSGFFFFLSESGAAAGSLFPTAVI